MKEDLPRGLLGTQKFLPDRKRESHKEKTPPQTYTLFVGKEDLLLGEAVMLGAMAAILGP